MLRPKKRLVIVTRDDQDYCEMKWSVYDTDACGFIENKVFGIYETEEESSLAILSLDSIIIDNHEIKANYGTT